jgi:hypothetical protein
MTQIRAPFRLDETSIPEFTPVPMQRNRHDGWTPERQARFLRALSVAGTVDEAARITGISRKSCYQLRAHPAAASFARAWDLAISTGRARIYDYLMERTLNGVTTIRLKLGGAVEIGHNMDGQLVAAHLKAPLPGENRFDAAKRPLR